jgi:hypothetical protein
MTKLYQLHIDKEIVPDWCSDIYHSRLYRSTEACMDGCLTEELFGIAAALWRHVDIPKDAEGVPEIDFDEIEEIEDKLKDSCEAGDKKTVDYIENVRQWLRRLSNKSFFGDWSMVWNILEFEVVNES